MSQIVTQKEHTKHKCNEIVTTLITLRKEAKFSQLFMADWLGVSRKKLNEFENGKFDFDLMLNYADKLSVAIHLKFIIS